MFVNEAEMQRKLSEYARKFGGFSEIVEDHDFYKGTSLEEDLIIDAYDYCLESLYETVLITEEENISLFKKEQLKPDFLLFDPGFEKFVIVELKNEKNATRQAGTELGAYANAIKTHFPMIADTDVVFIVISSEWPTLLKNYLFNEIFWHKKKILCLRPILIESDFLRLECLPPNILFTNKLQTKFRSNSFSGMQYCIYGKGIHQGDPIEELDKHILQVKASFERIIRKSQQKNSHGFAFLWKDLRNGTLARYSVTFVDINPFEKFHRQTIEIENDFSEKLYRCISEWGASGMTGTAIESMRSGGYFLDSIANPAPEGAHSWEILKEFMLERSKLISFKPFGIIADLYEEHLSRVYAENGSGLQYDDPHFGLAFTEEIMVKEVL
ncbi:hypothetical protein T9A_00483 [Alcanivorax jadensis T9]|jgi:hypothetical protein|uniref:Uncharacterized protein n=1 Tax=Alcanivorax jadensis T9 TaxID=1177181 RepID=A0ABR4WF38_9GAMM|nr:hypothetical protein [Alcanivorax jadensis]KGD62192.1 hypothetical protein T9A_00483 [Alcanivorax jadensis T9]|tara:strand:- start:1525 stop:2676 length:1152 start_codon:yes stop_codon:yes gene_type:complete